MKKLLITGIEGFTGNWLFEILKDKYDIYGTCKNNVECGMSNVQLKNNSTFNIENPKFFVCDITDYNQIRDVVDKVRPDYIIHLAAISFVNLKNALPFYNVNVLGTENLLNALLETKINPQKIILASSANIYGRNAKGSVDENIIPDPVNHYSVSKLAMEFMAKNYMDKLNLVIVRPFNYTGPGQEDHFLIPKIVRHYKEKKENIELGNLDVIRDFSDVRFVCECYGKLLENGKCGEVYNISSSSEVHLKKIIDIMNSLAGYNIKVDVNPEFVRKNEIYRLIGDNRKILSLFESNPVIEIEKTLEFMYSYDI
ncbi:MAG: GDP-mannose 4,6-dehydratase [Candidatus Muirbacterium halophilum]|nr:GDP-mannose 4,6-dehydratase [Candidatus Muirbacterium halophilum]